MEVTPMNARSKTRTALLVAMTLMLAPMAASVDAAPRGGIEGRAKGRAVACRTVATYGMSAWVAPMAVVLTSPEAWSQWNREQVDAGRAVAEEALPMGVDWTKEVVLVLALGEVSEAHSVELTSARRNLNVTELNLHVEPQRGGNCPALVLCLERGARRNVKLLTDYTLKGVPTEPGLYESAASLASTQDHDGDGLVLVTSWGAIKAEYR
jgi:hypothetical protein